MAPCPRLPLPRSARRWIWLLLCVGLPAFAGGTPACDPRAQLPQGQALSLKREAQTLSPTLKVTLTRELRVRASRATFGLAAADSRTQLTQEVLLPSQPLGLGKFDTRAVAWDIAGPGTEPAQGELVFAQEGRRFQARVVKGKVQDAGGNELRLAPDTLVAGAVNVSRGAMVTALTDDEFEIAAGAVLVWNLDRNPNLSLSVVQPAPLAETMDASATGQLKVLRPTRAVPGGVLEVQLQAPGFNLSSQSLAFCFASVKGAPQVAGDSRLLSQSGGQATFEVRVPDSRQVGAQAIWHGQAGDLWDQVFGVPTQLRVVGYADGRVMLDGGVRFNLANAWTAFLAGVALLLVLFVGFGLLAGKRGARLKALQSLLLHSSGRYSLSKTQVMLWTALVLFALMFVWVSSGEILVISSGMLVLLGISGTSSVLARAIEGTPGSAAAQAPQETVTPTLKDLVLAEDGEGVDLMRFQMLGFTLFTWGYSLLSVLHSDGLPEIPQHLYVLMGVSNATYLGGKLVGDGTGTPGTASTAAAAPDGELLRRLQLAFKLPASTRLDAATLKAVKDFKAAHGLLPADESISAALVDKVEAQR